MPERLVRDRCGARPAGSPAGRRRPARAGTRARRSRCRSALAPRSPARASASKSGVRVNARAVPCAVVFMPPSSPDARITPAAAAAARPGALDILLGVRDRGPELEQPTAERDRADREPRPAEGEPRDHVREPVVVEQHAARGDRDRDPDGRAGEQRPARPSASPAEDERGGGVERRSGRRVPARERRSERRCESR